MLVVLVAAVEVIQRLRDLSGGPSTGNIVPAGGTTYGNAGGTSVAGYDPFAGGGGGGAGQVGYPGGNQKIGQ